MYEVKKGRPRKYETDAEKQAAYRRRHAGRKPPTEKELAHLARKLDEEIGECAMCGDHLAVRIRGRNSADTLRRLMMVFVDRRLNSDTGPLVFPDSETLDAENLS